MSTQAEQVAASLAAHGRGDTPTERSKRLADDLESLSPYEKIALINALAKSLREKSDG